MRKINFMKKIRCSQILASLAMIVSMTMSDRNCVYIFHQPTIPPEVRKLKKN